MAGSRRARRPSPASEKRSPRSHGSRIQHPRIVLRDPRPERDALLQRVHEVLLRQPVAAQAVVSALVAEGRRFAGTPAGRRWLAKLDGSDLVRRGQSLWEASSLVLFEEDRDTVLPSALIDSILGAIAVADGVPALSDPWEQR